MITRYTVRTTPWAQNLGRRASVPIFPCIPTRVRPYALAVLLFFLTTGLQYVGDEALLRYGLPWALISLLVVAVSAEFWGVGPSALVLALSVIFGIVVVPFVHEAHISDPASFLGVLLIRSAVFILCGALSIWLTYKGHLFRQAELRKGDVIKALQTMVVPVEMTPPPGFQLSGVYRPALIEDEVGGDFYDFYPNGSGQYGILIGDIMGRGKEAATSTALIRYSIRALSATGLSPAQVLRTMNALIDVQSVPFQTASVFFGLLDVRTGTMTYASAGHEPPMLRHGDGTEEELSPTGPILGTRLSVSYDDLTVKIDSTDSLLLVTDGVTEARDRDGFFLNEEGVWRLFRRALSAPTAQETTAQLESGLSNYIGSGTQDDIAILLLRGTTSHAARTLGREGSALSSTEPVIRADAA